MKKRLRKKRHIGEFKQCGIVFTLETQGNQETADAVLEKLGDIIDKHNLTVVGEGQEDFLCHPKRATSIFPTSPVWSQPQLFVASCQ